MIVAPKQFKSPTDAVPAPVNYPPPPQPAPVNITVDNSKLEATIADVQRQMLELSLRMDQTILELADAVAKLNPGTGFSVTVTEWTQMGRIKTLKIVKE